MNASKKTTLELIREICKSSRNSPLILKAYKLWLFNQDDQSSTFIGNLSNHLVIDYEKRFFDGNIVVEEWDQIDSLIEKMFERMKEAGIE